jgi:hypothetical protein
MKEKQIELLQRQIEKLNDKKFDLEAWKKHTVIILAGIFGEDNVKAKQIEKLEYEYNSWSLRDTSGHSSYLDSCKKLGKEILQASIDELEIAGAPAEVKQSGQIEIKVIIDALDDELKGSQFKAMMKLLKSSENQEEKARRLNDILKELDNETIMAILKGILLHQKFRAALPDES